MNVILCNMCMIEDAHGRVLVQHRRPKPSNPTWFGMTFPGGHVEAEESIYESVRREVREETGLSVSDLHLCGFVEWETVGPRTEDAPAEVTAQSKYIVFLFRTRSFQGSLHSSAEGDMEWMTLNTMRSGHLAPHMEDYLQVLLDDAVCQAYGISGSKQLVLMPSMPNHP